MRSCSSAVSSRSTFAGTPTASTPLGMLLCSPTSVQAAMIVFEPTCAWDKITAFIATNTRSPTVAPCTIAPCPTVHSSPIVRGASASTCSVQLSWILVRHPITMGAESPRTTVLYQMLAPSWIVTFPMMIAPGAMKTFSAMVGVMPLYGRMGISAILLPLVCYYNSLYHIPPTYLEQFSRDIQGVVVDSAVSSCCCWQQELTALSA